MLVADIAYDLFKDGFERDQPGGPAILIDHDGDVRLGRLEFSQEVVQLLTERHKQRWPRDLRPVDRVVLLSVTEIREEILSVNDAHHVVDMLHKQREAGMAACSDCLDGNLHRGRYRQSRDRKST